MYFYLSPLKGRANYSSNHKLFEPVPTNNSMFLTDQDYKVSIKVQNSGVVTVL